MLVGLDAGAWVAADQDDAAADAVIDDQGIEVEEFHTVTVHRGLTLTLGEPPPWCDRVLGPMLEEHHDPDDHR